MRLQVQTFKALSEYASFSAARGAQENGLRVGAGRAGTGGGGAQALPPIQVDLHIHLPENKTTRDYEAIIQDIARYIYGRDIDKA